MSTKKLKIVVTRPIHEAGLTILKKHFDVTVHDDSIMTAKELKDFVKGADGIVSLLTEKITADVLDAAGPQLKIVAQFAVGYDNIDLKAAAERNIYVTNTPGYLSGPAVAEHVFNLMFAVARHTVPADAFMRTGKYKQWDPNLFLGQQLTGKTVGIVGGGQIGSIFAGMCHNGMKMKVLYYDVMKNPALEKDLGATKVSLEKLLVHSDIVSLHVPLLPSTQHMISKEQFHIMKPNAILINTARGPVVDEAALGEALKNNVIYGAGIDVFEHEPKLSKGLEKLENLVVTPHIGSATEAARIAMAECVARNVMAVFAGEAPANIVK
jgi:lactate dehydrogenase-like 2-hydroxyacid dehydrogenase